MDPTTNAQRAQQALDLVTTDPRRAIDLAADVALVADRDGDHAAGAVAVRARGLAAVHLDDLDSAVAYLRHAVELGRRAGSPRLAAEARMTLAYALSSRGRWREALREIDTTLKDVTGVERARAQAQRGAILHRLGRLEEALVQYRTALSVLRQKGDLLWVQRVLSNRGYLRVHLGEHAGAIADLHEAEGLCQELGLDLSLGFVHQNLGFATAVAGDIPVALRYIDLAERCFLSHGSQLGSLLVDRAEVLLSARLVPEARDAAGQAVAACERTQQRAQLPEARLLLARAAQLDNDAATALREASRAAREFARLGQAEWAAIARVRVLTIRLQSEPDLPVATARIQREIDASRGRWPGTELDIQLAAAECALAGGRTKQARALLTAASRRRHRGATLRRAAAWHAETLLRQTAGDRRGAISAARAGLRLLDAHASTLGATDLRAYASGHRRELVTLGLRMAFEYKRTERVFEWAELGRARHLYYPPARPPDDPDLAGSLAELRLTVREINERRRTGSSAHALQHRQLILERHIRDHHRRHSGDKAAGTSRVNLSAVSAELGDAALLEFVELGESMHVVSVTDGRARLTELGSTAAIRRLVDALPFALHRLVRPSANPAARAAAVSLVRDAAGQLDATLLAAVPHIAERPLVIVPTGPLQPLPWSILPSCTGRPVTVAPSAALWHSAREVKARRAHVIAVAGPGLPGARAEAQAVAAVYGTEALIDEDATVQAVSSALNRAALAHLATHGTVRGDNPLFSALQFADGPLMVYDLEKIQHAPHTVVVAACDTGRPVGPAGDELMGLSATFLAQGTAQLIASVVPIPDLDTAALMVAFHRRLATGEPAAAALAAAQADLYAQGENAMAIAAGFVCFGAGLASPLLGISQQSKKHVLVRQPVNELEGARIE
jgi:tetratricopeptide (TPR) repeat protein